MKAGTFASPNTSVAVFCLAVHGIGDGFSLKMHHCMVKFLFP
jgi:hypothetical protein